MYLRYLCPFDELLAKQAHRQAAMEGRGLGVEDVAAAEVLELMWTGWVDASAGCGDGGGRDGGGDKGMAVTQPNAKRRRTVGALQVGG